MLSTHVLDTSIGNPAAGVEVRLEKENGSNWTALATEKTNNDGRIAFSQTLEAGRYRLTFNTEDYFKKLKVASFFPTVPVIFEIKDLNRKYHVPLLLNPYGYSTYRGS